MKEVDEDGVLTAAKIIALSEKKSAEEIFKFNGFALNIRSIGSDLARLPYMEVMSLSLNSIESLAPFSACSALRELHLRKNNITNLLEVAHLAQLPQLRVLLLSDNPCCSDPLYRVKVLRLLPNLRKLDSSTPTEDECHKAQSREPALLTFDRNVDAFLHKENVTTSSSLTLSLKHCEKEDTDTDDVTQRGAFIEQQLPSEQRMSNALHAIKILLNDLSVEEIKSLHQLCDGLLRDRVK